ncbi:MAG: hypothetical protein V3U33_00440 [candidate division NC10 bacterium]
MDSRQKALTLFLAMVGLFGFHLWLLSRTVARGDILLSGLLIVAVSLFSWRSVHYWTRFRAATEPAPVLDPQKEILRMRNWSLLLVGLLVLHSWLFLQVLGVDIVLAAGLGLAIVVFVYRLGTYGLRFAELRKAPALIEEVPSEPPSEASSRGTLEQDSDDLG